MTTTCSHLGSINVVDLPDPLLGCSECLAMDGRWVHLRMCLTCGQVGCCDNSPARHATAHFRETGHPLIRSAEPDEGWAWCFVDEIPLALSEGSERWA
ncbi:MAG: UBP-type zinc finger domain-containing protein [Thermoleophilia bacterium]|nr:UBP-type zinc finger domain-containing protein [Thermoleophilia bacterium]MDH5281959.1 UBP-type zinc finger domain-containing protein [Thermoleophilia bacterium]